MLNLERYLSIQYNRKRYKLVRGRKYLATYIAVCDIVNLDVGNRALVLRLTDTRPWILTILGPLHNTDRSCWDICCQRIENLNDLSVIQKVWLGAGLGIDGARQAQHCRKGSGEKCPALHCGYWEGVDGEEDGVVDWLGDSSSSVDEHWRWGLVVR